MKINRFATALCLMGSVLLASISQATSPVFFLFAHEDDAQIFAGGNLYDDAKNRNDVVIIYVTAGDAGLKDTGWGTVPYYRARELAAAHSMRIPAYLADLLPTNDGWTKPVFNGKTINRYRFRNVHNYFLRLPDGGNSGAGFEKTLFQSLSRSHSAVKPTLTAVDNSATYTNWADLVKTVQAIITSHSNSQSGWWINTHDYNPTENPDDHADHYAAGKLAWDAGRVLGHKFALWMGYHSQSKPVNLSEEMRTNKLTMYGALAATLAEYGYNPMVDDAHLTWLGRSYFRAIE